MHLLHLSDGNSILRGVQARNLGLTLCPCPILDLQIPLTPPRKHIPNLITSYLPSLFKLPLSSASLTNVDSRVSHDPTRQIHDSVFHSRPLCSPISPRVGAEVLTCAWKLGHGQAPAPVWPHSPPFSPAPTPSSQTPKVLLPLNVQAYSPLHLLF